MCAADSHVFETIHTRNSEGCVLVYCTVALHGCIVQVGERRTLQDPPALGALSTQSMLAGRLAQCALPAKVLHACCHSFVLCILRGDINADSLFSEGKEELGFVRPSDKESNMRFCTPSKCICPAWENILLPERQDPQKCM